MLKYIIKRILTFIPMLIAISLIAFIISINAPGDPVERMTQSDQDYATWLEFHKSQLDAIQLPEELRRKLW